MGTVMSAIVLLNRQRLPIFVVAGMSQPIEEVWGQRSVRPARAEGSGKLKRDSW